MKRDICQYQFDNRDAYSQAALVETGRVRAKQSKSIAVSQLNKYKFSQPFSLNKPDEDKRMRIHTTS